MQSVDKGCLPFEGQLVVGHEDVSRTFPALSKFFYSDMSSAPKTISAFNVGKHLCKLVQCEVFLQHYFSWNVFFVTILT